METILLNIKEVDIKKEILDCKDDELESEEGERYVLMNDSNESQTVVTTGEGDFLPKYIKEEELAIDPLSEEGFSFHHEEEAKYTGPIEEESAENATKYVTGLMSENEEESKIGNSSRHIQEVLIDDELIFPCQFCNYVTNLRWKLRKHHLIHSDIRPFKCTLCDSAFKENTKLRRHVTTVHSDLKPFKCPHCEAAFKRNYDLKGHLVVHSDIKPFKCSQCDLAFKLKSSLKRHLAVHSDLKPFHCAHCELTFKRRKALLSHMVHHSDKKPFKCSHCESTFKHKYYLKRHSCSNRP